MEIGTGVGVFCPKCRVQQACLVQASRIRLGLILNPGNLP